MADRRLPAVYVSVEDKSYVSETLETGRIGYTVVISDRGPHNKVVQLNSPQDLYDIYGEPNFVKFGQGHYLANQHLKRSSKLFVVRPAILEPIGDMVAADCAAIANASVRLNSIDDDSTLVPNNFELDAGSNLLKKTNPDDIPAVNPSVQFSVSGNTIKVDDYLVYTYNAIPKGPIVFTQTIIDAMKTPAGATLDGCTLYFNPDTAILTMYASAYADVFTDCQLVLLPVTAGQLIVGTIETTKSVTFEVPIDEVSIGDTISDFEVDLTGSATNFTTIPITVTHSNITAMKSVSGWTDVTNSIRVNARESTVTVTLLGASSAQVYNPGNYNNRVDPIYINGNAISNSPLIPGMIPGDFTEFKVGDIIFPADDSSTTFEVVEINDTNVTLGTKSEITFKGQFKKFVEIEVESMSRMISEKNFDTLNSSILWNFYVVGAGSYYNDYFIKGVRNSTYDKMYTDDDGNADYPYAFMDIAIYRDNNDNTTTLMEGPWTVSLIEKTAKNVVVRDVYTGTEMYLPTVINRKSKIVRVVESRGVDNLVTMNQIPPYAPDTKKRIAIQKLLTGKLTDFTSGIKFANGSNGNMFDSAGRINLTDELKACLTKAFNGTLTSSDGSIEQLLSVLYPKYLLDYIYCGGWDHNVNYGAKELADNRGDCLLLSDTGSYKESHDEDMDARQNLVPWNTWNAALYINYRQIFDSYTGKRFYITPVYHAIDRHLYVDDQYWISEPVAGVEKGAIEEAIELAYAPNETQLADEIDVELNPVISESDGVYILQQFTTWKRLSIMKRQHAVKFIHYCKKRLPSILKDILNRKGTQFWQNQATARVNAFMNQFLDKGDSDRYASITSYSSTVLFDSSASELQVGLVVALIRSIERITVNIVVV